MTTLTNRWLKTKRHLRSLTTTARAGRDAERYFAVAALFPGRLCRRSACLAA